MQSVQRACMGRRVYLYTSERACQFCGADELADGVTDHRARRQCQALLGLLSARIIEGQLKLEVVCALVRKHQVVARRVRWEPPNAFAATRIVLLSLAHSVNMKGERVTDAANHHYGVEVRGTRRMVAKYHRAVRCDQLRHIASDGCFDVYRFDFLRLDGDGSETCFASV